MKDMAKVYRSVCDEADTLLLSISKLAEKEIRFKLEIEKLMNKGFVDIAKARYIMGSTCVTKMQLPTGDSNPIEPLATVCRAEVNNHWVFHIHRKDVAVTPASDDDSSNDTLDDGSKEYDNTKNSMQKKIYTYTSEKAFTEMLKNDPKALKTSKKAFLVDDDLYKDYNNELLDELSSDSESVTSLKSVTDPIRLFGILVPNTLKQAQVFFKEAVDLLGKCATLQSQLNEAMQKYMHVMRVKSLIESAAEDRRGRSTFLKPKIYWTPSEMSTLTCSTVEQGEAEEKGEEVDQLSEVSVQKSIRSVFYDFRGAEVKEVDSTIWGSEKRDSE